MLCALLHAYSYALPALFVSLLTPVDFRVDDTAQTAGLTPVDDFRVDDTPQTLNYTHSYDGSALQKLEIVNEFLGGACDIASNLELFGKVVD